MSALRAGWMVLVAAGCAPGVAEDGWGEAPDLADAALADNPEGGGGARSAVTLGVTPIVPGDQVTFTVTGAGGNELVHLARSTQGLGAGPCLGTLGGLCLDITNVALHGDLVADAGGVATLTQTVPESVPIGADVWFQAVIPRGASGLSWVKSQVYHLVTADAPLVDTGMVPGDLRITEIHLDPAAVTDAHGEWFEVYNASGLDANLDGLTLSDGVNVFPITGTHFLGAGEIKVFGIDADPATNGGAPVDWAYTGLDLADLWGEVYLMRGNTVIDGVAWDDGASFPLLHGVSLSLPGTRDHLDNDLGENWCLADRGFGAGDFGSPGQPNPACVTDAIGSFAFSPASSAREVVAGGGVWGNVVNTPLTLPEALVHTPKADTLWVNQGTGAVVEYVFDGGVLNRAGPDIVVFDARYDAGEYTVSAEHDGFVATAATATAGWTSTGVVQSYWYQSGGPAAATIWASEIDLDTLGVPAGDVVYTIRTTSVNAACDPLGIGAL